MQNRKPRFNILALAPFHTDAERAWTGSPLPVGRTTLDEVVDAMGIHCRLPLEKSLCPQGELNFHFQSIKALHPDSIVQSQPYLRQLQHAAAFIKLARSQGKPTAQIRHGLHQWPDLPAIDITEDLPEKQAAVSDDGLENLLNRVALSDSGTRVAATTESEAAQLASIAGRILAILFSDSSFRTMEAAWRGLRLLLQQGVPQQGPPPHVSVAAVHAQTLAESLGALTPHLLEALPDLVLLDMPFDNTPLHLERLTTVAQWAATLMVPTIAWVGPRFLQISSWQELQTLPFIPNHLTGAAYAKFNKLQASEAAPWLCLACNRFMLRYPYGPENPTRHISFPEPRPSWT
ncbi:MAG: hypothetical protein HKP58_08585, partial [Desulfatitalea sp.]|nr:type VI secretion system contractile sheath large subunit [Desulfatitalea sp.]NNK00456.1 hypothetical protein [Desulfatitalea sp.]